MMPEIYNLPICWAGLRLAHSHGNKEGAAAGRRIIIIIIIIIVKTALFEPQPSLEYCARFVIWFSLLWISQHFYLQGKGVSLVCVTEEVL
jgi:hypothetical protein